MSSLLNPLIIHLKNILRIFLLHQDLYAIYKLLFSLSLRKKNTVYLLNQRSFGFGHQILELRYARKVSKSRYAIILSTKRFANKFLHTKMTSGCIRTIKFNFTFIYDIVSVYLESKNYIDVGAAPNELSCKFGIKYGIEYKIFQYANEGYRRIYDSFPSRDFSDLPQFFTQSEESSLYKKLRNRGINPNIWFTVLHIRNGDWSRIRNTSLEAYSDAIDFILQKGGQVLLTGDDLSNTKDLPYLSKNTQGDLQLFALAKQKMMIACSSGPQHASFLFDLPVILTNHMFWETFPWSCKDSSLPKMIRSKKTNKFLNRSEYMELRKSGRYSIEGIDCDYELVDNSTEEIRTAVVNKLNELETNDYKGRNSQSKFINSFDESSYVHSTHSKIDDSYYKKYKKYFEN